MKELYDIMVSQYDHEEVERGRAYTGFHTKEDQMAYLRDMCLALNVEISEFLMELPWKPWKSISDQGEDLVRAESEWADCFIFLMNLWIALHPMCEGDSLPLMIETIKEKQTINKVRQEKKL